MQHNWHNLLRKRFPLDQEEAESTEADGLSEAAKDNAFKGK